MNRLLLLLFKYRTFIFFLCLEVFCAGLVVNNNSFQRFALISTIRSTTNSIMKSRTQVLSYFRLTQINDELVNENAKLRIELSLLKTQYELLTEEPWVADTSQYEIITTKVVSNSIHQLANYITLNKGTKHGVVPNLGVMSKQGVVGKVKDVSENFSTVYSLLNIRYLLSSKLKKNNILCSVNWDGKDNRYAKVLYVPKHITVEVGDSVVTSGFNANFHEGVLVGFVNKVFTADHAVFHDITVELANDFGQLSYLYLIKNLQKDEKDNLETHSFDLLELD